MQAPITATIILHILNPVTPDAPMKLNIKPPIMTTGSAGGLL